MKKTLLLAVILGLSMTMNAQRVWVWQDSINVATMVADDTVMQPDNAANLIGTMGSYYGSCDLDCENLDANTAVGYVGGGLSFLRNSKKYYNFEKIDSVTLDRTVLDDIVRNGGITDTTYIQNFVWTYPFGYDVPMIGFKKVDVTSGYFRWKWAFFRQ